MQRPRRSLTVTVLTAAALALAGCSGDGTAGSTSGSTGADSSTGPDATTDDPLVQEAVTSYHAYVTEQAADSRAKTRVMTDAIRAGDLDAARAAYAPSRVGWERIEPIAKLVEELDGSIDSRADDVASAEDPDFTGWHKLEYLMFEKNTLEGAVPVADKLDADLATLETEIAALTIPPAAMPVGASELIEEASQGKITGEEDRYSKTDLWDLGANIDGSRKAIELLTPALQAKDPELLATINTQFAEVDATLQPLRQGDGWVLYCVEDDEYPSSRCTGTTIDAATRDRLKSQTAALSESTSQVAGALGLS